MTNKAKAENQDQNTISKINWEAFLRWGRILITLGLIANLIYRLRGNLRSIQVKIPQPYSLIPAAAFVIGGVLLSTILWRLFFLPDHKVSFKDSLSYYLFGILWNNFLPSGFGGDFVRGFTLNQEIKDTEIAVTSVLMTRLAGLWSIVIMAVASAVSLTIFSSTPSAQKFLTISAIALTAAIIGTILLLTPVSRKIFQRLPEQWSNWYTKLSDYSHKPIILLKALAYSLCIQIFALCINLFISKAFNLNISLWQLWLSLPLITLITLLPISIGGFGVRENAYILLLGYLGVTPADGLVLSLAVYILITLITALGSLICLFFKPKPSSKYAYQQQKAITQKQMSKDSNNLEDGKENSPLKILIINWRDPTHPWAGGAEVFLDQIAQRWVQAGHSVTWFSGKHKSQTQQEHINGINFFRRGSIYSVYPAAAITYLTKFKGRFDVILESSNGIPFFTPIFSSLPKIALVHHVHGDVFIRELPWYLAHLGRTLEEKGFRFAYRNTPFIAVSKSTKRSLVEIGVPEDHISIIHNAVDGNIYQPGNKKNPPRIAFVGRLRRYKNVEVAIKAMPYLLKAFPEIHLDIVGSGSMEGELKALAHKMGLTDHIHFTGYVDEQIKVEIMQGALVAVHTSMKEGWGLTVLEFNACGTPVVASNVLGLKDSIVDGETGILVPYGDPEALANEIIGLLKDQKRRLQMSQKAIQWAEKFNWDLSAQRCLDLIKEHIEENANLKVSKEPDRA